MFIGILPACIQYVPECGSLILHFVSSQRGGRFPLRTFRRPVFFQKENEMSFTHEVDIVDELEVYTEFREVSIQHLQLKSNANK